MDKSFEKTLRLNILELLNYNKSRKLMKKLSDLDILGQLHTIYSVTGRKPSGKEVGEAIIYLLDRNLVKELEMGDVSVYAMTRQGRELLQGIYDGDDTAVI
jgi:hypothetical protein